MSSIDSLAAFERGLELYSRLVRENPALQRELEASRADFGAPGPLPEDVRLYERRHLEWFLFDRPSDVLGGAPAEALFAAWSEGAEPVQRDLAPAYLESVAGAFEVLAAEPARGLEVRDLVSLGRYAVGEVEAAHELEEGDLVVGRLHPFDGGVHRFSPAAAAFRNPALVEALRGDLERERSARRGVLRIEQRELEKLFFHAGSVTAPSPDPAVSRERAREALLDGGLAAELCDDVLDAVTAAGERGDAPAINALMDQLAFDTDADLEALRRAFAEMAAAARTGAVGAVDGEAAVTETAAARSAREALEEFDRGRAAGRDLDELFGALERDLGVAGDEPGSDVLDGDEVGFPGVVGAVVEEFLWDVGREGGPAAVTPNEPLRALSRYAADLPVFEELGARQLLDFGARWLIDDGELATREEARAVLEALGRFCRWCEEHQAHPLWTAFGPTLEALLTSVPRLVALRAELPAERRLGGGCYRVQAVGDGRVELELAWSAEAGVADRLSVPVPAALGRGLRFGDLVRVTRAASPRIGACYPAELGTLLRQSVS